MTERVKVGRPALLALGLIFSAICGVAPLAAQPVVPGEGDWRTLQTAHFAIHYDAQYRGLVLRAAAIFERVHEKLEPRYKSGVQVTHVAMVVKWDVVQSFALPWGFDQIVLYVDAPRAGQFSQYDSWIELLFTHEYTHILTLRYYDTGFLTFLRVVFGAPPNMASPRGLSEGIAVYEESRSTGKGRLNDPISRMVFRSWVLDKSFPQSGEALTGSHRWPLGAMVYLFGGRIWKHVSEKVGDSATADYWRTDRLPFAISWRFLDLQAGSFGQIYREVRAKETAEFRAEIEGIQKAGVTPALRLTTDGYFKDFLTRTEKGEVLYWAHPSDQPPGIYRFTPDGIDRIRIVEACSGITSVAGMSIASEDYHMVPGDGFRYELYNMDSFLQRLTPGRSVRYPALTRGGNQIFYIERDHEVRRLVLADVAGRGELRDAVEILKVPFTGMLQYAAASPDGLTVAALVRDGEQGNGSLTICARPDASSKTFLCRPLVSGEPVKAQMHFSSDGKSILFSSDAGGVYNLYSVDVAGGRVRRLTRTLTGLFYPVPAPDGLFALGFFKNGYDLVFLKNADLLGEDADALFAQLAPGKKDLEPLQGAEIIREGDYGGPFVIHPYFAGIFPLVGSPLGLNVQLAVAARDPLDRHYLAAAVGVSSPAPTAGAAIYDYNRYLVGFSIKALTDHFAYHGLTAGCARGDESYRIFCEAPDSFHDQAEAAFHYVEQGRYLDFQGNVGYVHKLILNARQDRDFRYDAKDLNLNGPMFSLAAGKVYYYPESTSFEQGWMTVLRGEYYNRQNSFSNLQPNERLPVQYGVAEGGATVFLPSLVAHHVNYLSAYGYSSLGPDREVQAVKLSRFVRGLDYSKAPSGYSAAVFTYEYRFPIVSLSTEAFSDSPELMIRRFGAGMFVDYGSVFHRFARTLDRSAYANSTLSYGVTFVTGLTFLYNVPLDLQITIAHGTGRAGETQAYVGLQMDFDGILAAREGKSPITQTRRMILPGRSSSPGYFRDPEAGGLLR